MAKRVLGLGVAPTIFATVCVAAMSTIVFVHHNQKSEKEAMREGVRRDIERESLRLAEKKEARQAKPDRR